MNHSKDPWYVTVASYASYLVVLIAGIWIGTKLSKPGAALARRPEPQILAHNELVTLNSSTGSMKTFDLNEPKWIDVQVDEFEGKNIEFTALQDGRSIYQSGIQRGSASGHFRALPGLLTVKVVNDNLFDSKSIAMSVRSTPLE